MSTGGSDDPMLDVDGDMHRLTPRLRWRNWLLSGSEMPAIRAVHSGGYHLVLEQAWQNVRTGALVWRPVEVEP